MYSFKKFKEFYENNFIEVDQVDKREFGYGIYGVKIKKRHLHFKNNGEFNKFLREVVPFYVSSSLSLYEFPDARPMEKKGWIESNFAFDIDAETTYCDHPDNLICEKCMANTKESVFLLLDILKSDLGLNKFRIVFSGNRGYHVYVEGLEKLTQRERIEIIKYCVNPDFENIISLKRGGWYLRFKNFILNNLEYLANNKNTLFYKLVNEKKEHLIKNIKNDNWDIFRGAMRKWKNLIKKELKIPDIDANVSTDLTKLLRVPNTLHGSSGLCCVMIKNLDKFDPFSDPVVFSKELVNYEGEIPKYPILGVELDTNTKKIPEYLAIYLELKGYGKVI